MLKTLNGKEIRAIKMWHLHLGFPLKFTTEYISNIPAICYFGQSKTVLFFYGHIIPANTYPVSLLGCCEPKIIVAQPD